MSPRQNLIRTSLPLSNYRRNSPAEASPRVPVARLPVKPAGVPLPHECSDHSAMPAGRSPAAMSLVRLKESLVSREKELRSFKVTSLFEFPCFRTLRPRQSSLYLTRPERRFVIRCSNTLSGFVLERKLSWQLAVHQWFQRCFEQAFGPPFAVTSSGNQEGIHGGCIADNDEQATSGL